MQKHDSVLKVTSCCHRDNRHPADLHSITWVSQKTGGREGRDKEREPTRKDREEVERGTVKQMVGETRGLMMKERERDREVM